ncbi:MAG: hypothetical protein ACOC7K_00255, partial [bacterium]
TVLLSHKVGRIKHRVFSVKTCVSSFCVCPALAAFEEHDHSERSHQGLDAKHRSRQSSRPGRQDNPLPETSRWDAEG